MTQGTQQITSLPIPYPSFWTAQMIADYEKKFYENQANGIPNYAPWWQIPELSGSGPAGPAPHSTPEYLTPGLGCLTVVLATVATIALLIGVLI